MLPCLRYINSDDWVYEAQTGSSQACPDQGPILSQVGPFMHIQPHTEAPHRLASSRRERCRAAQFTIGSLPSVLYCVLNWFLDHETGRDSCPWQPASWRLLHVAMLGAKSAFDCLINC